MKSKFALKTIQLCVLFSLLTANLHAQVTITLQPDSVCGKDALLTSLPSQSSMNFGNNDQFLAAAWTVGGVFTIVRSIVEFDLSSIPAGATITSAQLSLYAWASTTGSGPHSGLNDGWLNRITSPWVENTVTWNTAPTFTTVNQVALPQSTGPNQDYLNIPVTTLVQDMVNNPGTSFGFMAQMQTEQTFRRLNFCSSDHLIPARHPKLVITYTSPSTSVVNPVNLGPDTTLCPGQNLPLSVNVSGATYLWQDNSTNSTFTVTQPGTYWVQANTCSGVFTDTIVVNYSTSGVINLLGPDTLLCLGQNLILNASTPSATYSWQDLSTNSTFNVTQTGTYWVNVSVGGCVYTDSINVGYIPPLSLNLGPDTVICSGQNLFINPPVQMASYLWSNNSTNPSFLTSTAGTYWLQLSNTCETISDTILVNVLSVPVIDLGPDNFLCPGQTVNLNANSPNSTYQWQNNSTNSMFSVGQPGTYWVNVTNNCGTTSDTIVFIDGSAPSLFIGNDTTLCLGKNLIISNVNPAFNSYQWSTGATTNSLSINLPGTYWLQASTNCGNVSDTIEVVFADCDCNIYIPNTFTPDNNEYNDQFLPVFKCNLFSYEFTIYNRWGEVVFQSNDPLIGWDGTYGGKIAQDLLFNYSLKYTTEDNINHVSRGHVNLLR